MRIATNTLLLTLACLLTGSHRLPAEEPAVPKEFQIKAAFIYNFTKFVEWPAARLSEPDSPILIGVFGKSPVAQQLPDAIKDRKVNGRAIVFKAIETMAEAKSVHLLFVPM